MRTVYYVALISVISLGMTSAGMGHEPLGQRLLSHGKSCGQSGCKSCGHKKVDLGGEACSVPSYGSLSLSPGCCDSTPSCCDDVWAGYCQERDDWKEFVPRRFRKNICACGATDRCESGTCSYFAIFDRLLPVVRSPAHDAHAQQPHFEVEGESGETTPAAQPAVESPSA